MIRPELQKAIAHQLANMPTKRQLRNSSELQTMLLPEARQKLVSTWWQREVEWTRCPFGNIFGWHQRDMTIGI